jgi:hypothetical protein
MQMIARVGYAEYATIDDIWRIAGRTPNSRGQSRLVPNGG